MPGTRYRELARRCRANAARANHNEAGRNALLRMAAGYEQRAEILERRHAA